MKQTATKFTLLYFFSVLSHGQSSVVGSFSLSSPSPCYKRYDGLHLRSTDKYIQLTLLTAHTSSTKRRIPKFLTKSQLISFFVFAIYFRIPWMLVYKKCSKC